MTSIIISTDPNISGGIAKINSLLFNKLNIKDYLIISEKKPHKSIHNTKWIKSFGSAPVIFFNFIKLIKIIVGNKNSNSILLSDPQFSSISFIIFLSNFFLNKKILFISHGFLFHEKKNYYFKKNYFKFILKFFFNYFTIISVSQNDSKILKYYKYHNFIEIFNGVKKLKRSKIKKYEFCLVGRNVNSKKIINYIDFLNNFKKLNPQKKKSSVLITDNLKNINIPKKLNLSVHHKLSQFKYEKILSQSKYMLSFSNYEGFGLAILEGISANLIPICKTNNSFINIFSDTKELLFKNYSYKNVMKIYMKVEKMNNYQKRKLIKKLHNIYLKYGINKMIKNYKSVVNN